MLGGSRLPFPLSLSKILFSKAISSLGTLGGSSSRLFGNAWKKLELRYWESSFSPLSFSLSLSLSIMYHFQRPRSSKHYSPQLQMPWKISDRGFDPLPFFASQGLDFLV
ncbi:hypothetical protein AMTRI_Chr07g79740 [Amborella trichopoda]